MLYAAGEERYTSAMNPNLLAFLFGHPFGQQLLGHLFGGQQGAPGLYGSMARYPGAPGMYGTGPSGPTFGGAPPSPYGGSGYGGYGGYGAYGGYGGYPGYGRENYGSGFGSPGVASPDWLQSLFGGGFGQSSPQQGIFGGAPIAAPRWGGPGAPAHDRQVPASGPSGVPGQVGLQPGMRRASFSGTPATQGYLGATSALRNANQGGNSGLAQTEATNPGMSNLGLYGTGTLGLQRAIM